MNAEPTGPSGDLSLDARLRVERVCAAFEGEWRAGREPDPKAFLALVNAPERDYLRTELAAIRDTYRAARARTDEPPETNLLEWAGARLGGRFEFHRELGRGGMGIVFLARDRRLHRLVAVKLMREGLFAAPAQLRRFLVEARTAAALVHPNIVHVHEAGESGGLAYLVLEYVRGLTLSRWAAGRPVAPAEAAALVEQLARAAHYAHQRGVIHRDIKPDNVLMATPEGNEGAGRAVPKLADFGLAKQLEGTEATPTGAVLGTPSYMAPEQVLGTAPVGPAADLYSLGATLYELLTGRPPFKADTPLATMSLVATAEPARLRALNATVSADLEAVCLKCLAKAPRERYATANELADDLRRHLAGEPTAARPLGRSGRAWRAVRRRRTALAGAFVLSAAVAAPVLVVLRPAGREPGPPQEPGPARPLRERQLEALEKLQGELRDHRRAELLDSNGMPLWPDDWPLGLAATIAPYPGDPSAAAFQTQRVSPLALLPDVPHAGYHITAELRHVQNGGGGVGWAGLFIGGARDTTPEGWALYQYLAFRYSDDPSSPERRAGRWELQGVHLVHAYDSAGRQLVQFGDPVVHLKEREPAQPIGPTPWRTVCVTIGPNGGHVRVSPVGGAPVEAGWDRAAWDRGVATYRGRLKNRPALAALLKEWAPPQGRIGIYAENASVAFRRATFEPVAHNP